MKTLDPWSLKNCSAIGERFIGTPRSFMEPPSRTVSSKRSRRTLSIKPEQSPDRVFQCQLTLSPHYRVMQTSTGGRALSVEWICASAPAGRRRSAPHPSMQHLTHRRSLTPRESATTGRRCSGRHEGARERRRLRPCTVGTLIA
jgi:hypothetical protein